MSGAPSPFRSVTTNWEPTPDEERLAAFAEALGGDGWTFDGNLTLRRKEDRLIFDLCDTLAGWTFRGGKSTVRYWRGPSGVL